MCISQRCTHIKRGERGWITIEKETKRESKKYRERERKNMKK